MKRLALLVLVAFSLAGCLNGQNVTGNAMSNVLYVHDATNGVGCWYFSAGGVSCLPDKDYQR